MPYFKDQTGALHFLDDASFSHLLPDGCVGITDTEATELQKPTLVQAKVDKWEAVKAERDRRKSDGFKVQVGGVTKWFHSDVDSRIQHLGLKDKARDLITGGGLMTGELTILGQSVKWKTMDGTFVDVSAQIALDIVSAAGDLDAQLFSVAETHKAAMEAAVDPSVYDFSGDWPKTYQESLLDA